MGIFSKANQEKKQKSTIREYVEALLWAVILALIIKTWGVQAFKIPSGSMMPTLLIGDHLLVSKSSYGIKIPFTDSVLIPMGDPQRGDVVVFRFPEDRGTDFIKRIIGLPGETVTVRGQDVYINGKKLDDPWGTHRGGRPDPQCPKQYRFGPTTVPEGEYFVMGDNRDNSRDSRCWFGGRGGFVPREDIVGRAFMIYWAWEDFGWGVRWDRLFNVID